MPDFDLIGYLNKQIVEYDNFIADPNLPEHIRKEFEYFRAFAEWFMATNSEVSIEEISRLAVVRDTKLAEANKATNIYVQNHTAH